MTHSVRRIVHSIIFVTPAVEHWLVQEIAVGSGSGIYKEGWKEGRNERFYLTAHSTHFNTVIW